MSINLKEWIYNSCPIPLQNILIGLYGLKLRQERYSKGSDQFFLSLLESEFNSAHKNRILQDELFDNLVKLATQNTVFYRNYLLHNSIAQKSKWCLDDLKFFPVIEKSILREAATDFVDETFLHQKTYITFYTSGTTGAPLRVYSTKEHRSNHYAFFSRVRKNFGLKKIPKRATLFGRIIIPSDQVKPPFWRYDWAQKNLLMSSYHLSHKNLKAYVEKLRTYKPDEIFAYPSSIYEIARYINDNNLPPIFTRLIMTTAENLADYQRAEIEKAFSCKIVNQYGCTEMSFFAAECEFGTMHVNPEHGVVEVLQDDGEITKEGQGELIATGFVNLAMPVIRYRIGDRVALTSKIECQCGRSTQVFTSVDGRTDDTVYKLDGTPVGRLDPIFKGRLNIEAACIIQSESGDIDIQVIPKNGFSESDQESLVYEMKKRVGNQMAVTVTATDSLPKAANGKFRPVISKYKRTSP